MCNCRGTTTSCSLKARWCWRRCRTNKAPRLRRRANPQKHRRRQSHEAPQSAACALKGGAALGERRALRVALPVAHQQGTHLFDSAAVWVLERIWFSATTSRSEIQVPTLSTMKDHRSHVISSGSNFSPCSFCTCPFTDSSLLPNLKRVRLATPYMYFQTDD